MELAYAGSSYHFVQNKGKELFKHRRKLEANAHVAETQTLKLSQSWNIPDL